jgi:hypothetical protein
LQRLISAVEVCGSSYVVVVENPVDVAEADIRRRGVRQSDPATLAGSLEVAVDDIRRRGL